MKFLSRINVSSLHIKAGDFKYELFINMMLSIATHNLRNVINVSAVYCNTYVATYAYDNFYDFDWLTVDLKIIY